MLAAYQLMQGDPLRLRTVSEESPESQQLPIFLAAERMNDCLNPEKRTEWHTMASITADPFHWMLSLYGKEL